MTRKQAREAFDRLHQIAADIMHRSRGQLTPPEAWHQAELKLQQQNSTPDLFTERNYTR